MSHIEKAIEHLWHRTAMMIGGGHILMSNDSGAIQIVQIKLGDDEIRSNTPRLGDFGFASRPPKGTDCIATFMTGNRSTGAVIATNHKPSRPRNMNEGESQQYDVWGKSIYLTKDGGIIIEAKGTPVTVNNASTVTINASTEVVMNTPLLKVTGNIIDNCETNDTTLASFRQTYNEHHHKDVLAGGDLSGIPKEQI